MLRTIRQVVGRSREIPTQLNKKLPVIAKAKMLSNTKTENFVHRVNRVAPYFSSRQLINDSRLLHARAEESKENQPLQKKNYLELGKKLIASGCDGFTHLPLLIPEIEEQLRFMRPTNKCMPNIMRIEPKRMEIFELLEKEFEKRKQANNITYAYWLRLAYRLAVLWNSNFEHRFRNQWVTDDGLMNDLSNKIEFIMVNVQLKHIPYDFPYQVLIPTTAGDINFIDINKGMPFYCLPAGLIKSSAEADGRQYEPDDFFLHDLIHFSNWAISLQFPMRNKEQLFFEYCLEEIEKEKDSRTKFQLHFMLFMMAHEQFFKMELIKTSNFEKLENKIENYLVFSLGKVKLYSLCEFEFSSLIKDYINTSSPNQKDLIKQFVDESLKNMETLILQFFKSHNIKSFAAVSSNDKKENEQGWISVTTPIALQQLRFFAKTKMIENKAANEELKPAFFKRGS